MAQPFIHTRRVEFCETDAAGIVHFSSFFLYMEQAEHALLRDVGLSVHMRDELGVISWPRVAASCEYQGPACFEDLLTITVSISRMGEKSITYEFGFRIDDRDVATGRLTTVCCRLNEGRPPTPISIPPRVASVLGHLVVG